MKPRCYFFAWAMLIVGIYLFPGSAAAQPAGSKSTIGVHRVQITDSLKRTANSLGNDKVLSLQRTAESIEQQLIDRIHNTRKFTVVSRNELNTILKDQDLQQFLSDPDDANISQAFKVAGCRYALILTIDDYQDKVEKLQAEGGQVLAQKRYVRLSAVAKIFDTTRAELLETANFQLDEKDGERLQFGAASDGAGGDHLMTTLAREMADLAANRVVDVVYPAKIIALTGRQATINRGDGTGIAAGQTWDVYATGKAMIDPDTGENLGAEEILIGKLRILSVTPKFSTAEVVEDYGVNETYIVRMAGNASSAP